MATVWVHPKTRVYHFRETCGGEATLQKVEDVPEDLINIMKVCRNCQYSVQLEGIKPKWDSFLEELNMSQEEFEALIVKYDLLIKIHFGLEKPCHREGETGRLTPGHLNNPQEDIQYGGFFRPWYNMTAVFYSNTKDLTLGGAKKETVVQTFEPTAEDIAAHEAETERWRREQAAYDAAWRNEVTPLEDTEF